MNDGIDSRREQMFSDYNELRREKFQMHGMKDYDRLKQVSAARRYSQSQMARRIACQCAHPLQRGRAHWLCSASASVRMHCICWMSLKTAFHPNGSWSWRNFLHDSARFYNCQFIIATHSPFLLAMPGARVYDLDAEPVTTRKWTELENVKGQHGSFFSGIGTNLSKTNARRRWQSATVCGRCLFLFRQLKNQALLAEPNSSIFSRTVALMASAPGASSLRGSKPLPSRSLPASMYFCG